MSDAPLIHSEEPCPACGHKKIPVRMDKSLGTRRGVPMPRTRANCPSCGLLVLFEDYQELREKAEAPPAKKPVNLKPVKMDVTMSDGSVRTLTGDALMGLLFEIRHAVEMAFMNSHKTPAAAVDAWNGLVGPANDTGGAVVRGTIPLKECASPDCDHEFPEHYISNLCGSCAPPAPGSNREAPVIEVKHADLTRASDESPYRSRCPACEKGILLVSRNQQTGELLADDCCIACAQRVTYTDIEALRNEM